VGTSGSVNADRDFVEEQLAMGTAEVELGRLAQQRATHADVKEFAAMMVRDHQMAADELRPIAARVNTGRETAGSGDHTEHRDLMEDLAELSGREFDRKYMEEMIDDHEKGVRELERRAENAADADVKQWASRTLPKMRERLERAKSVKETLDRAGDY
jgi:putative membrane protein